jgi:hypothetical protein
MQSVEDRRTRANRLKSNTHVDLAEAVVSLRTHVNIRSKYERKAVKAKQWGPLEEVLTFERY